MKHRFLLILFYCCATVSQVKAQKADAAALDTLFNRLDRSNKAMGSILLSKDGETLYQRGFGQAQTGKQAGIANTPETVYRIGSITKMFTAAIILRLVEEHKLHLTDTIAKWFPRIPNAGSITIDHLLMHRSGIHNLTSDTTFMSWQDTVHTKEQIIARINGLQPDFTPAEKFEYSNTNYILLGYIIEEVTGMPYSRNLRQIITAPLKLDKTGFGMRTINPQHGEALPYYVEGGSWIADSPSSTEVAGAAGGIVSTVGDMAKFIDALMRHKVISDASLKKMLEIKEGYGRGMMQFPFYDKSAYGHNGHIDNFTTSLAFFPKDSLVLSIACNGVNYNFNNILIGVLSLYYGKPYTMPDFGKGKSVVVDAAKLKRLEGIYTSKQISMDITIAATAAGITAQATGQGAFPLEPVSETEFTNEDAGVNLNFTQKGDEPATTVMLSQGGSRVPFIRKN